MVVAAAAPRTMDRARRQTYEEPQPGALRLSGDSKASEEPARAFRSRDIALAVEALDCGFGRSGRLGRRARDCEHLSQIEASLCLVVQGIGHVGEPNRLANEAVRLGDLTAPREQLPFDAAPHDLGRKVVGGAELDRSGDPSLGLVVLLAHPKAVGELGASRRVVVAFGLP